MTEVMYKKLVNGDTVYFQAFEAEEGGGGKLYKHSVTLVINYADGLSATELVGIYTIYSTSPTSFGSGQVSDYSEILSRCSGVPIVYWGPTAPKFSFFTYDLRTPDQIKVPVNYGGGYTNYTINVVIIAEDNVMEV